MRLVVMSQTRRLGMLRATAEFLRLMDSIEGDILANTYAPSSNFLGMIAELSPEYQVEILKRYDAYRDDLNAFNDTFIQYDKIINKFEEEHLPKEWTSPGFDEVWQKYI